MNLRKTKIIFTLLICYVMIFNTSIFANNKTLNLHYDNEDHTYEGPFVNLIINGETLTNLPLEPIVINERTLVPAREVFEALGATVMWVENTEQILITLDDDNIILQINNDTANVNGEDLKLDLPPKIIYYSNEAFGKTMIPIRFVGENLGFNVGWEEETQSISIDNKDSELPNDTIISNDDIITIIDDETEDNNSNSANNLDDSEDLSDNNTQDNNEILDDNNTQNDSETLDNDENTITEDNVNLDIELAIDVSPMVLTSENNPKTNLYNIEMPSGNDNYVKLKTTSKMSNVTKSLLHDNRLVIDIYNTELSLNNNFNAPNNSSFSDFRISQHQLEPDLITRAVFQLEEGVSYYIQFNDDRTELIIGFKNNVINNVDIYTDGEKDYIEIEGTFAPDVITSKSSYPRQLHVSMPNSILNSPLFLELDGVFIKTVYTSDVEGLPTVFINLLSDAQYSISKVGNTTIITLGEVSYDNITYIDNSLVIFDDNIDLNSITHTDNYSENEYIVSINKNIENIVGTGTLQANDTLIRNIDIKHYEERTDFIFTTNTYIAINQVKKDGYIHFEVKSPKDVYSKVILIDAGHGGSDPGAMKNSIVEKNINLEVAKRLQAKLEANTNFKVYMTRIDDVFPTLQERVIFANEVADLFFSIHVNSNTSSKPNGTEVHYYSHENDDTIGISSKRVASITQVHLINQLGTVDRGIKETGFFVVKNTEIPAILIELGFLSNVSEAEFIKSEDFLERASYALYLSVVDIFNEYTPNR